MDESLASIGGPGFFEWKGKAYRFAPPDTVGVTKGLTNWLIKEFRDELRRQASDGVLDRSEYEQELSALRDNIAAKKFVFGGSIYQQSLQQRAGQMQLVLLMVRQFEPAVTTELIEDIWTSAEGIASVLGQMELLNDPNSDGAMTR